MATSSDLYQLHLNNLSIPEGTTKVAQSVPLVSNQAVEKCCKTVEKAVGGICDSLRDVGWYAVAAAGIFAALKVGKEVHLDYAERQERKAQRGKERSSRSRRTSVPDEYIRV
jgi:hypothetical protein